MSYTNSSLADIVILSPNHSGLRTHKIDTITIHCVVAQVTAKRIGEIFLNPKRRASSNYGVGLDGSIGLYVEEKNRSWCSSSKSNDQRAITIEVASDNKHPYAVTDKAYEALIELVADICKRNGIKRLKWSTDKHERMKHLNGCNMTVHRDYSNRSCPGEYLYSKHGDIARKVNEKLGAYIEPEPEVPDVNAGDVVKLKSGATYYSGKAIPGWVKNKEWIIKEVKNDRAVIDKSKDGKNSINSAVNIEFLEVLSNEAPIVTPDPYEPKIGDIVHFKGNVHFASSNGETGKPCKPGKARIAKTYNGKHPYQLLRIIGGGSTVYGWVDKDTFTKI